MALAPHELACESDFIFRVDELDSQDLKVTAFEGLEGISELFDFRVELCSDDPDIDLATIIGKPCSLEIQGERESRFVHGIVRRFARSGDGSQLTYYTAEVAPLHWLLTKRFKSRVFHESRCPDMTVPGIIRYVFENAGITPEFFRFALQEDYEKREFVVQYRESDMDFISRLMEEEGIFFFFEHTADGHRMVLGDSLVAHEPVDDEAEFPFRDANGLVPEQEHVFNMSDQQEVRMGAVCLDDFNFKQPGNDLHAALQADRHTGLEFSDYPGDYLKKPDGQRYARLRLEEFQCARQVVRMSATVRRALPGYTFQVGDHPRASLNREYLATHVTHRARQPQSAEEEASLDCVVGYEAEIRAIPSDVPFRAARKTLRPHVRGSQTAIVVGPEEEEIYTDEYGRVKVQFHWDREGGYDQHSSCWIRVSQGMAGGNYGMMFLPRVGQEVLVDFLEGNPDRPIITGRVYNNDHMPPYALPGEKTKSTIKTSSSKGGGGSNEIRFEDLKDNEQFLLHAQKDLHLRVKNDRVETIENDCHLTVNNNKVELVKVDRSLKVDGNKQEEVGGDVSTAVKGMVSLQVDGTYSATVSSDVVENFNANHKHEVALTYAAKATNIKLEAAGSIELKCGGSSIVLTPTAIFITGGPLVNINSGSGPPVSPVTAQATTPEAPAEPLEADTVEYGKDTRYDAEPTEYEPVEVKSLPAPVAEDDVERQTSWIEIVLVDEANQPIPGERYELLRPDGRLHKGRLDANGFARVNGVEPGTCQICFPNLDSAAWERI